ncbi:MAG: DUF1018 domain-containing protein [Spirochaetes bacterium]|nr:MAG: DUF1018 domain-containing protein [Spirochaetota bacterium]
MISAQNRRHIFYLCTRLGLDELARHTIQHSVCGKEHLSDMNDSEAGLLIQTLKGELRKWSARQGTRHNHLVHGDNIHNLMTPEQRGKIVAMSIQAYGKFEAETMDRFCRRQFKKPYRLLTSDDAIKLIEIQKGILKRKLKEDQK